jgi:GTP cyclohydrolase III
MVKSCILVCCKLLKTKRVVELAKKQAGVKDAFPVHGRWDIAVSTDDLDLKKIAQIGMNIYKAEGVEIVETLIGYPE